LEAYAALLSPAELAAVRSGDDVAEGVRTERLLSRALARVTLARYVRAPPAVRPARAAGTCILLGLALTPRRAAAQALRFGRNAHGKPWLAPPDGGTAPRFSIAHAPGALLCAVAAGGELGCDVEAAARGSGAAAERLSRRYYAPPERAALEALPAGEPRRRRFLELWTLKEAYVKALGRGIAAAPLDSFALHLTPSPQERDAAAPMRVQLAHGAAGPLLCAPRGGDGGDESAGPTSWRFALLRLAAADGDGDGHLAAVCAAEAPGGGDAPLALRCWRTVPLGGSDEEHVPALLAFGR